MTRLGVWMNGEQIAVWSIDNGHHVLTYDVAWAASPRARALSVSLPITALGDVQGPAVARYFDHLLPEDPVMREHLQARHGAASSEAWDLLAAVGGDCVGAVQVLPEGKRPIGHDRMEYIALRDAEVESLLNDLMTGALAPRTATGTAPAGTAPAPIPMALPGSQPKTALLRVDGRWCRPVGATPSTHILKLPFKRSPGQATRDAVALPDAVENEWLCGEIVRELGLPVAASRIGRFGVHKVLLVERFDREWMEGRGWIARLPQEDLCQATAAPAGAKYEADGGPGLARCLEVLAGSDDAVADRQRLVLAQLVFWLLAATDGHAKNFSIALQPDGRYRSTPLYGVLSAWPVMGTDPSAYPNARLAMSVDGATPGRPALDRLETLNARAWQALALRTNGPAAWEAMQKLVQQVPAALERVLGGLPEDFPSGLWEAVDAGVRRHAALFLSGAGGAPRAAWPLPLAARPLSR